MTSVCAANARQQYQECTSAITGNFNGTAIAEGNEIWFTGVLTVKGLGASKVNLFVSDASIAFGFPRPPCYHVIRSTIPANPRQRLENRSTFNRFSG